MEPGQGGLVTARGLFGGSGGGSMARKLRENGMDWDRVRENASSLPYDAWKHFDEALLRAATEELVAVKLLQQRGLVYNFDGMKSSTLQYQDMSDITAAQLSMSPIARGRQDKPEYTQKSQQLPFTFKDFSMDVREFEEAMLLNRLSDTTMVEECTRKCDEITEDMLFNGGTSYGFPAIYGFTTHPDTIPVTMATAWDDNAVDGADVIGEVSDALVALRAAFHKGPYGVFYPTAYSGKIDNDYNATSASPLTIRERILKLDGVEAVLGCDALTGNKVVVAELRTRTVRMLQGLPTRVVDWDSDGGLGMNFKIIQINLPQIRSDQANKAGVALIAP